MAFIINDMTKDDILNFECKLIDEMKKKHFLHKNTSKERVKFSERASAWDEIQKTLGQPVGICKRKWASLKCNFRERQRKAAEEGQYNRLENWVHYENLKIFFDTHKDNILPKIEHEEISSVSECKVLSKVEENCNTYKKCGEIMICDKKEFKFICWTCHNEFKDVEHFINHILKIHIGCHENNTKSEHEFILESNVEKICSTQIKTSFRENGNSGKSDNKIVENKLNLEVNFEKSEKEYCKKEKLHEKSNLKKSEKENYKKEKSQKKASPCLVIKSVKFRESKRGCFPCDQCKRIFEFRSTLYSHKKSHATEKNPFKCEICGQSFKHQRNLKDHFSISHNDERPFSCRHDGCNKKFKTVRIRKLHEILHTNDLPFQCQDCGKCFPSYSYLISHRNTWHVDKNNRRHKCQYCEKTFCAKQSLKFHIYTHTGERPYGCPLCSTRFTKPTSVKEHMKIHLDERKYICKTCKASFNQIAGLIQHKKRHEEIIE